MKTSQNTTTMKNCKNCAHRVGKVETGICLLSGFRCTTERKTPGCCGRNFEKWEQAPTKISFFRRLLPWLFVLLPFIATAQIQPDKVKHFVAGAVIGGTTQFLTYKATGNKNTAFFVGLGASTLAGVAKELYDKQGHGTPDIKDAVWTSIGGLTSRVTLRIVL